MQPIERTRLMKILFSFSEGLPTLTTQWKNVGRLRIALNVSISGPNIEQVHVMEYEDLDQTPTMSGTLIWMEGQTSVLLSAAVAEEDGGCYANYGERDPNIRIKLKDKIECSLDSSESPPRFFRGGKQSSHIRQAAV